MSPGGPTWPYLDRDMSERTPPTLLGKTLLGGLFLGLVVAGCGGGSSSSDSDSDSDGGGGGSGEVRFASGGQTLNEQDTLLDILVLLTTTVPQDVSVDFTTTGNAQNNGDFVVLTNSPLIIPNQQTQGVIKVQIVDDMKGEIDEYFILEIVGVSGAKFGSILEHRVDILDDDGSDYAEAEPNDDLVTANTFDVDFGKTESYQITGTVDLAGTGDPQDYFNLVTAEAVSIDFNLDPTAAFALGKLTLLDGIGNVLATFVSPGPGLPLGGVYVASAGEVIYALVETEASITPYFLDVVGLEFPGPNGGEDGPAGEGPGAPPVR